MDVENLLAFKEVFIKGLYTWRRNHPRSLPWKKTSDPYLIWLSEVILQQTRVEHGTAYYLEFSRRFPTVFDLADATEDEVLKCWQGLGYYSRARNLHQTARYIAYERGGHFPQEHKELLQLKGIGSYTAAAIASFAFNKPHAVLDGNVFRVLARVFGVADPINSTSGKKLFAQLADQLLDHENPAYYNQAIMDFGALTCKAPRPNCRACTLQTVCKAFNEDSIPNLPVKIRAAEKKRRYFNYLVVTDPNHILIHKRTQKDIWQNLYEFPLFETSELLEQPEAPLENWSINIGKTRFIRKSRPYHQTLSHQKITAVFWEVSTPNPLNSQIPPLQRIKKDSLKKFPFPKIVDWYLEEKYLNLLNK